MVIMCFYSLLCEYERTWPLSAFLVEFFFSKPPFAVVHAIAISTYGHVVCYSCKAHECLRHVVADIMLHSIIIYIFLCMCFRALYFQHSDVNLSAFWSIECLFFTVFVVYYKFSVCFSIAGRVATCWHSNHIDHTESRDNEESSRRHYILRAQNMAAAN